MKITKTENGKTFYLCKGERRPYVWKSSAEGAYDLSKTDALVLAEVLKLGVVHLNPDGLHVVGLVGLHDLDHEKVRVRLVVIEVCGSGNALDKPSSAVSRDELLALCGYAHGASSCEKGAAYHAKFCAKAIGAEA